MPSDEPRMRTVCNPVGIDIDLATNAVHECVHQLGCQYREAPGMILTEDDLKCLLVGALLHSVELRGLRPTCDRDVMGSTVHCEVPWFNRQGRLHTKPDITILDPGAVRLVRGSSGLQLPHKGFEFSGNAVLIELKFLRNLQGLTPRSVVAITRDLNKIEALLQKLDRDGARQDVYCFVVVFSKVDCQRTELQRLAEQAARLERCELLYEPGSQLR